MDEFVAYLHEVLEYFGPIQAKRMFGGYGLYHNSMMFALVADNVLYFKADHESAKLFEALDLKRFEYMKRGKPVQLRYYEAPQELFEEPEAAKLWAERAYQAAVRAATEQKNEPIS